MAAERRKARRLKPYKAVRIILSCKKPVVGRIRDISTTGASVECETAGKVNLKEDVVFTIFSGDRSLDSIRCLPVYDIATLTHNQTFRGKYTRQIGLRFKDIRERDKTILNQFMSSVSK
jgi:c-di-GMP-binding flagellar brake protein YcgR